MSAPPEVVSGSTLTLPPGDPPSSSAAASWTFCESTSSSSEPNEESAPPVDPRHLVRRGRATDDRTGLVRVHESRRDHIDHDGNRDEDAQEQPAPPPKGVQDRTQIGLRPRRPFHAAAIIRSIYRLSRTWSQAASQALVAVLALGERAPFPSRSLARPGVLDQPPQDLDPLRLGGTVQILAGSLAWSARTPASPRSRPASPSARSATSLLSGLPRSSGRSSGSGITARSHAVAITETISSLH